MNFLYVHARVRPFINSCLALAALAGLDWATAQDHDHNHDHEEHEAAYSNNAHGDESDHGSQDHGSQGHDEEDAVRVDPATLREFDIQIAPIGPGELHEVVILPGEIKFNRERLAYATPRFRGTILEINARLADAVKQGDVLATLENPDTLRPFQVTAPFDGTIVAYDIAPGQTVDAGSPLFTVANLSTVWADLQIYQRNIATVHEGQPVVIKGGHETLSRKSEIAYIAPTIDEHTRTGLARVVLQNDGRRWKPGQFIRGIVSIEEHPVDLLLPRSAILTLEDQRVVFVRTNGDFEPRPVELGHFDEENFEVLSGLNAGDLIVVKNPISLKAEMGKDSFGGHGHAH